MSWTQWLVRPSAILGIAFICKQLETLVALSEPPESPESLTSRPEYSGETLAVDQGQCDGCACSVSMYLINSIGNVCYVRKKHLNRLALISCYLPVCRFCHPPRIMGANLPDLPGQTGATGANLPQFATGAVQWRLTESTCWKPADLNPRFFPMRM